MYAKHKAFRTPPDDCVIWRYISFAKFVWLLATRSLYFSRLDQHIDEWEGMISKTPESIEHRKYIRFSKYINCWHINKNESDAMWKLYGPEGENVAIKSTVGALKSSLQDGTATYIGEVIYEGIPPEGNLYWPVVYKRIPFMHENELRLCISSPGNNNPPDLTKLKEEMAGIGVNDRSDMKILKNIGQKGISIRVDVCRLLNEVVICRSAGSYLKDAVAYILKSNGLHVPINESIL